MFKATVCADLNQAVKWHISQQTRRFSSGLRRIGATRNYLNRCSVVQHIIQLDSVKSSFDETLIEVWRQALVENAKVVELGEERYPVRRTPKGKLRQVDFVFDGNEIRGLEQNPETKTRWAQLARSGKKVMQFLSDGRYVANVVDGKVTLYGAH